MAEQDKDLPLVVAEILIEVHGMNGRLEAVESRLGNVENQLGNVENQLDNVENRLGRVENLLVQAVDNIQQLSSVVKQSAENAEKQVAINSHNFQLLIEADQRNTTMLATSIQNALATIGHRFDSLENRLERLENK